MSKGIGIFWGTLVIVVVALCLLRIKPLVSAGDATPAQITEQQQHEPPTQPRVLTHEPTILNATTPSQNDVGSPLQSPLEDGFSGYISDAPESPTHTSADLDFLPIPTLGSPVQR